MPVEFNKVTWYSKLLALAMLVALPFIGFYFGRQYEQSVKEIENQVATTTPQSQTFNIFSWIHYTSDDGHLSAQYPFFLEEFHSSKPSLDWRMDAQALGTTYLDIKIDRLYEPGTNFVEGIIHAGKSSDAREVKNCLTEKYGELEIPITITKTINGKTFTVIAGQGAGAGNYYETKYYRTVYNNVCYAIDTTIHSANIYNYPQEFHVKEFDRGHVAAFIDAIVKTIEIK
jgi:hypothetical protein